MSRRKHEAIATALMCAIWFTVMGLFAITANGQESCPDGQVKYLIQEGVYEYGQNPDINDFGVTIEGTGPITCTVKAGCHVTCACVADGGLHWIPFANELTWEGGDHVVFWGGCQVPGPMPEECMLPARVWMPLVVKR